MASRQRLDDDDDVAPQLLRTFELSARVERPRRQHGGKSDSDCASGIINVGNQTPHVFPQVVTPRSSNGSAPSARPFANALSATATLVSSVITIKTYSPAHSG